MSGEKESKVDDKLAEITKILEEYSNSLGFGKVKYKVEVEEILNLGREELEKLDGQQCGSYAYMLAQYALFL